MSEVQVNDDGGKKKGRQKKQVLRVDFTPMVDMNMLLITFFMFSTTLLKPQVMNISMPSKEKAEEGSGTEFRASTALTILLGDENDIYYYEGMPTEADWNDTAYLKRTTYNEDGIRAVLMKKNDGTYQKIQELKEKRSKGTISEQFFTEKVTEIQTEANKNLKIAPNVLIKPTDNSSYKNMVDALDEMLVCNIGFYQIGELTDGDRYLLYLKSNKTKPDYLTDAQKKDLGIN
ncbi:biopolymer transporter ExbD [Porphyromonadaceae bacterium COT-184 OH4590]|nr:biopolymer transporter ExbD [Porphyromonadaceae bacterium COT-184 OH4590]MDO4725697.1 biopolymer transporter ExbD [Porphyromonadaceae bacterium]